MTNLKTAGKVEPGGGPNRKSEPDNPLVSVITVCLNSEKHLEETILSVLNQTYGNIEYIIIDGGSKDRTPEIIKKYAQRIDRLVSEPDKGIYDAMNKGIALAAGEIVGIINSDDRYEKDAVEAVVERYRRRDRGIPPAIYYGYLAIIDESGKILREEKEECKNLMEGTNFRFGFKHPTCFVPKIIYDKMLFNPTYKILGDWDFFYRVLKNNGTMVHIEKTIAYYRTEGKSTRPCYISKIEKYRIRKKLCGRGKALFCLMRETGQHLNEVMYRKIIMMRARAGSEPKVRPLKVALASAGLGHVPRGVEAWTEALAYALEEKGVNVTLYKGGGPKKSAMETVLPCIKRFSARAHFWKKIIPDFGWRFGLGDEVQLEQTTFGFGLIWNLLRRPADIIHTQEATLATNLRLAQKLKIIKTRLILAHGTNEPLNFLKKFEYIQHLTPSWAKLHHTPGQKSFMIPNFIDTERFRPGLASDVRKSLKISPDAFVILSAATIIRQPKRIDYLLKEVSLLPSLESRDVFLVIAGAETRETPELVRLGRDLLGGRVFFLLNHPPEKMPELYAAADIFVLCSSREMCSVAVLEALSAGLPTIATKIPTLEWEVGPGGKCIDTSKEGALAEAIPEYFDRNFRGAVSVKAREWVIANFGKKKVVDRVIEMYRDVLNY